MTRPVGYADSRVNTLLLDGAHGAAGEDLVGAVALTASGLVIITGP